MYFQTSPKPNITSAP